MKTTLLVEVSALVATFAGVGALSFAAARAPMPSAVRAGIRGLKRQRALAKEGAWIYVEPVVRWIGHVIERFLSPQLLASLDRQTRMAGSYLGLLPQEVVALSLLCTILGVVAGGLATLVVKMGPMLVPAVGGFGAVAPFMTISSAAADRAKAIRRRLPNAVDLLALGMSAGLDFPGALRQAVEKSGTPDDPLIEELSLILQSLQLGRTRQQALEEFAERAPIEPVCEFVGAVVQAELRGNPLAAPTHKGLVPR